MAIRRDQAIILRTRDYSESDRLITFFSRNQGQLTGIAKGARRSKKRFVHTLEPCSHVAVTYVDRPTSGLVRLDASELKNAFIALRSDIARLGYASLSCEIVLEMSPERQANAALFALLLHLSGYGPNLQGCVLCGRQLRAGGNWFFSILQGGLVCKDHKHGQQPYPVSLGTVMLLRQAQQLPLAKLWRLRFQRQSRQECRFLLIDLVRHYLEKDLKSLKLLHQIGALNSTNDRI
ncbi:MAG: DNA repair protein RecO [Deltaproteobacteria bacterium]|nr:DNA repair protein RecO [Deltaproteobacteria bacterium]